MNKDRFLEAEFEQPGRKRDPSRDPAILDATLEVLAEVGAPRLTMDMVAARAGAGEGDHLPSLDLEGGFSHRGDNAHEAQSG